jgi:GNAT superfamily N-acetyltransferase
MQTGGIEIRRATIQDVDALVPLFDAYRQFYWHPSAPEQVRQFLLHRFANNESIVFLAFADVTAVGFTQLYPSFSSGAMARIFILNDLFVAAEARRRGTGAALLQAAAGYGRHAGAARLVLSTELTNSAAQSLYEKTGWKRDTVFCTYQLTL